MLIAILCERGIRIPVPEEIRCFFSVVIFDSIVGHILLIGLGGCSMMPVLSVLLVWEDLRVKGYTSMGS